MDRFTEIVRSLPELNPAELHQLRNRISALLSIGGSQVSQVSTNDSTDYTQEDLVLRIVCTVVGRVVGATLKPEMVPKNAPLRIALREHLPDLMRYLEKIDERNRPAFLEMAVQFLVENVREMGLPLTPTVVIRQIHRLPAVVDVMFPKYYEAGLLNMIIRAKGE